ncbi:hypothetical protein BJV78DRAFT_944543 [Lactifluus subvellereus]|nr:hypothetical protein BJV78DRAFT_944543 [Lactifluus subvellereus]
MWLKFEADRPHEGLMLMGWRRLERDDGAHEASIFMLASSAHRIIGPTSNICITRSKQSVFDCTFCTTDKSTWSKSRVRTSNTHDYTSMSKKPWPKSSCSPMKHIDLPPIQHHQLLLLPQTPLSLGLPPRPPQLLLSSMLMGVAGRSTLVLAVGQGTCVCAGQRNSGCDPYNCCCCPPCTAAALATWTTTSWLILEGGWVVNPPNMECSVARPSFIEGWDAEVKCWEGADQGWGVVDMCAAGGAGAEEGDGGTITMRRGVGGWGGCDCGCGCDCERWRWGGRRSG